MLARADGEAPGYVLADLDFDGQDDIRRRVPLLEHRRPEVYHRPSATATTSGMSSTRAKAVPDRRRAILDAAVRVFARQGFHACRVSDIADEAGVAYGLLYHYFPSKEEVLNTLFLERWGVMLETIREVDRKQVPYARSSARSPPSSSTAIAMTPT